MKKHTMFIRLIAVLLLGGVMLTMLSCGSCNAEDEKKNATRIYVSADSLTRYVDLDYSAYATPPTLYDILRENDTLEADIDRSTDPDTLLSVFNVRAARGEYFAVYSSNAADAPEGAQTVDFDGITFYRISGDYMALTITQSGQYLIRLEKTA